MSPKFVYISGPYSNQDQEQVSLNIQRADEAAKAIALKGHYPFCPHTQSRNWECDPRFTHEDFLRVDLAWVTKCDWLLFLGHSPGADRELALACERGLVVFYAADEVPEATDAP